MKNKRNNFKNSAVHKKRTQIGFRLKKHSTYASFLLFVFIFLFPLLFVSFINHILFASCRTQVIDHSCCEKSLYPK